ncbi:CDP-glycerol glycerophosphotransferase family protein [uncultured Sphaerochaeta sp.]|uniref:CDP-glycerol glycerophosphotransferase family protein n=1 Tax=uncultured Sphaerochaeta sp. TaxID=886478 RepID=UPI002AA864C0|nr:CDP-glycerol glycerophosphotransferase family protein [uncultured Sphaerochaeta sp.]
MNKMIRYTVLGVKRLFIFIISALVPKNKKLWVFGAWQGMIYADNSKYLFEYVIANHRENRYVWVSNNDGVLAEMSSQNYEVYKINTWSAFKVLFRASIIVETEGNKDIGGYRYCRSKIIQLWHGVAPKKMDWNKKKYSKIKKKLINILQDNHSKSYWMTSSEQNSRIMHEMIGSDIKKSYSTGYSRNDIFARRQPISTVMQELNAAYPDCKKIIYMPTHRYFGTKGQEFTSEQIMNVDYMLRMNNIMMLFKLHIHEINYYRHLENTLTNIVLVKGEEKYTDVYKYIGDFDLLISDYSSIIYDFLCTKKPIILFPYDLDYFKNADAGLFDYYESMPCGPFCYTWDEVFAAIFELLKDDNWKERREICRKTFHPHEDGKNSERIYQTICNNILP